MDKVYNTLIRRPGNKIIAIGKNYLNHVAEMGGKEAPKKPVIFEKAFTNVVPPTEHGDSQLLTIHSNNSIHHEIELGVVISKTMKFYNADEDWRSYIGGYFLCLDLTDRTMQAQFKKKSHPWFLSKAQDNFMPVSEFIPEKDVKDPENLDLQFNINGKVIQKGNTKDMIFKIPILLEYISHFATLNEGDMIITGTPEGVGPIEDKDELHGILSEEGNTLAELNLNVEKKPFPTMKHFSKI
ncbi:unnamed protein product [Moneuplotes crassus]|uniref:Fumarylacetoacetase-like C-terminal domain-containing protein n=1 Tax=Euplotes crassus TaxID=5936 RepID=A0AAD1XVL0_EUPCR|nr:unnamed protein product [Moneuplotes crassus]